MNLVWIDTETGGLDPATHSLLTLALVIRRPDGACEHTEIAFQHAPYVVDAEAMAVNRIDLVKHHAKACVPAHAASLLDAFLGRHIAPDQTVMLGGHNVGFDTAFLIRFLRRSAPHLLSRISHRSVDTMTLAAAMQVVGVLPSSVTGLTALLDYFGVVLPQEQRHTALGDAMATAELFQRMTDRLNKGKGR
jgi:DNA polymerase III epsilon subunit-like protein